LERRTSTDIDKLRADLSRTNLELDQLREDEEQVKALVKGERESLRDTLQKCKGLADELATSGTRMNIVEERLGDACKDIKGNTNKIEDVNERLLQLHGDHEKTASAGADLANSMKKVKVHVKHVHEHLDKTHTTGGDTSSKVDDNAAQVADLASKVQMLHNGLMSVTQGHGMLKSNVAQMQGELSHVAATAETVKAGLKETSSILLPNINMDSVEARSATARHGSILQGHLTSPLFSPSATGKNKTPRPTSKSGQNAAPGSANFSAWT
jgi:chromosome segregation ATPase